MTEVLIAVGTLAVGMIFIAGLFPAAIFLTTEAAEQTIAAVVADEAFAKIRIIAGGPDAALTAKDFQEDQLQLVFPGAALYPSVEQNSAGRQEYCWWALGRRTGTSGVQVTVFVCRGVGARIYRNPASPDVRSEALATPAPMQIAVLSASGRTITVDDSEGLVGAGYTVVDGRTGRIYRVLERISGAGEQLVLDKRWAPGSETVWVVPRPFGGGRGPCIAVYQKTVNF